MSQKNKVQHPWESKFLSVLFLRRLYSIHKTAMPTESASITPMKTHSEAVGAAASNMTPGVAGVAGGLVMATSLLL